MEINKIKSRVVRIVREHKYAILITVIGLVFLITPTISHSEKAETKELQIDNISSIANVEERLSAILSKIKGAGKVAVMLTTATGEEIVYQVNRQSNERSESSENSIDTVIVSDKDRTESGLIQQVNPPKYLGAVIVCQGADDPKVQLAIIDAVSKITGLATHRISVLRMH